MQQLILIIDLFAGCLGVIIEGKQQLEGGAPAGLHLWRFGAHQHAFPHFLGAGLDQPGLAFHLYQAELAAAVGRKVGVVA